MNSKENKSQSSFNSQQLQNQSLSSDTPLNYDLFRHKPRYRWTQEQNIKYAAFLKENLEVFQSSHLRKKNMIFSKLAKYMSIRTTSQAKSHHQKMIKRHKSISTVIEYIEAKYIGKASIFIPHLEKANIIINELQREDGEKHKLEGVQDENHKEEIGKIIENYIQQGLAQLEEANSRSNSREWFEDI